MSEVEREKKSSYDFCSHTFFGGVGGLIDLDALFSIIIQISILILQFISFRRISTQPLIFNLTFFDLRYYQ